MNNKLIALAVAGALTAPMMAVEAAPTVYGRMAVEWAQTGNSATGTTDKNYVVDNKAGQFGFKGSEDLGGGLKAIYKMEFGIETSNNTAGTVTDSASATHTAANNIFNRETMIGLKIGKNHTIQMGNLKQPYKYAAGVTYDSFAATSMQAREGSTNVGASGGAMSGGTLGHGGFLENAVGYVGKFKPVTVHIASSALDDSADDQPVNSIAVSAKVSSFHFGFANINQASCVATSSTTDNCTADGSETDSTKFFGSWSMGQHTVRAQIEGKEVTPAAGGTSTDNDYVYINYQFKMGKHLVDVAVGERDDKRAAAGTDEDFTRLAYAYNFSKKTRVFAGIAESDVTNNSGAAGANDWDTFSVGMQVKF